jgi:glycosyltransferase involved in cell wall biosynthesis
VRIGIDMLGVQSPSRLRGIGRYTRQLVEQLLTRFSEHEYVLYFYEGLPGLTDRWPGNPTFRQLAADADDASLRSRPQRLAGNPDHCDILLVTCAFEQFENYLPPSKPVGEPKMVAILYDLIPALMPDKYLRNATVSQYYHWALRTVRHYDLLLAISEASRQDWSRLMNVPGERIVTIGAASDGQFFTPDQRQPMPGDVASELRALGIRDRFLFCLTGMDDRKNVQGLLAAYKCLPSALRERHQLVVTCKMNEHEAVHWAEQLRVGGIEGQVLFTNFLADEMVRTLYQRCEAFVFPSQYEGFGLPLLEAMHCGAAVVAGQNSSQPEVVGDAGLLADVDNPADFAGKIARVLEDPSLAEALRQRAPERARQFTWEATADRAMAALKRLARRPARLGISRWSPPAKPRLAYFSPLLPKRSGISDYSERLLAALRKRFTIDLYHDADYCPHIALASRDFACHDYRLFPRMRRALNYAGVVYQMGNSEYHGFVYETLLKYPGVVVLHDFVLTDFHYWNSLRPTAAASFLADEIAYEAPEHVSDYLASPARWSDEPGGVVEACNRRGLAFNRRILERAAAVVMHDRWGARRIEAVYPELADRVNVIPHGASLYLTPPAQKHETRQRFGLNDGHLVIGCFGILHPSKYNVETIDAFAAIAADHPQARLLMVGRDLGEGEVQTRVVQRGLIDKVLFFGHAPMETFLELMSITDIGVNLRRPPTHGETSGALLTLLGSGVPTIVTDVDTFHSYPDSVVYKIAPLAPGDRALEEAIRWLVDRDDARRRLSESATDYIASVHDWSRVAGLYAGAIEHARREQAATLSERPAYAWRPAELCQPS